ncbi:MAG: Ger(x)C family spore germination C-terminal domain-containing protein [Clostridia bacterium]
MCGEKGKKQVQNEIKEYIEKNLNNYLNKTCKEYNADINKFYETIKYKFLTVKEIEKYDWKNKYKNAKIECSVKVEYTPVGLRSRK